MYRLDSVDKFLGFVEKFGEVIVTVSRNTEAFYVVPKAELKTWEAKDVSWALDCRTIIKTDLVWIEDLLAKTREVFKHNPAVTPLGMTTAAVLEDIFHTDLSRSEEYVKNGNQIVRKVQIGKMIYSYCCQEDELQRLGMKPDTEVKLLFSDDGLSARVTWEEEVVVKRNGMHVTVDNWKEFFGCPFEPFAYASVFEEAVERDENGEEVAHWGVDETGIYRQSTTDWKSRRYYSPDQVSWSLREKLASLDLMCTVMEKYGTLAPITRQRNIYLANAKKWYDRERENVRLAANMFAASLARPVKE